MAKLNTSKRVVKSKKGGVTVSTVKKSAVKRKLEKDIQNTKKILNKKPVAPKVKHTSTKDKKVSKKNIESTYQRTSLTPSEMAKYKSVPSTTLMRLNDKQKNVVLAKSGFKKNEMLFGKNKRFKVYAVRFVNTDRKILITAEMIFEKMVNTLERKRNGVFGLNKLEQGRLLTAIIKMVNDGLTLAKVNTLNNASTFQEYNGGDSAFMYLRDSIVK